MHLKHNTKKYRKIVVNINITNVFQPELDRYTSRGIPLLIGGNILDLNESSAMASVCSKILLS